METIHIVSALKHVDLVKNYVLCLVLLTNTIQCQKESASAKSSRWNKRNDSSDSLYEKGLNFVWIDCSKSKVDLNFTIAKTWEQKVQNFPGKFFLTVVYQQIAWQKKTKFLRNKFWKWKESFFAFQHKGCRLKREKSKITRVNELFLFSVFEYSGFFCD